MSTPSGYRPTRAQKRLLRQAEADAQAVLSHAPTMRFLHRVLERANYYGDPMTGNSQTFFNLGQRRVCVDLLNDLQAVDPEAMIKMLQIAARTRAEMKAQTEETGDED